MTVVARRFASRPKRTSSETWQAISDVVVKDSAGAAGEFKKVLGVASLLISEEYLASKPMILVSSSGPRLRVYCLYDENALVDDDINEEALSWSPTENDWTAHLPCPKEELEQIKKELKSRSKHFVPYDLSEDFESPSSNKNESYQFQIDEAGFRNL